MEDSNKYFQISRNLEQKYTEKVLKHYSKLLRELIENVESNKEKYDSEKKNYDIDWKNTEVCKEQSSVDEPQKRSKQYQKYDLDPIEGEKVVHRKEYLGELPLEIKKLFKEELFGLKEEIHKMIFPLKTTLIADTNSSEVVALKDQITLLKKSHQIALESQKDTIVLLKDRLEMKELEIEKLKAENGKIKQQLLESTPKEDLILPGIILDGNPDGPVNNNQTFQSDNKVIRSSETKKVSRKKAAKKNERKGSGVNLALKNKSGKEDIDSLYVNKNKSSRKPEDIATKSKDTDCVSKVESIMKKDNKSFFNDISFLNSSPGGDRLGKK